MTDGGDPVHERSHFVILDGREVDVIKERAKLWDLFDSGFIGEAEYSQRSALLESKVMGLDTTSSTTSPSGASSGSCTTQDNTTEAPKLGSGYRTDSGVVPVSVGEDDFGEFVAATATGTTTTCEEVSVSVSVLPPPSCCTEASKVREDAGRSNWAQIVQSGGETVGAAALPEVKIEAPNEWRGWWTEDSDGRGCSSGVRRAMCLVLETVGNGYWLDVRGWENRTIVQAHSHQRQPVIIHNPDSTGGKGTDTIVGTPCEYPFGGHVDLVEGSCYRKKTKEIDPEIAARIDVPVLKPGEAFIDGGIVRRTSETGEVADSQITGKFFARHPLGPTVMFGEKLEPNMIWDRSYSDFEPDQSEEPYHRMYAGKVTPRTICGTWSEEKTGKAGSWNVTLIPKEEAEATPSEKYIDISEPALKPQAPPPKPVKSRPPKPVKSRPPKRGQTRRGGKR
ncbi:hypothetical protein Pelo_539 [Pelomyxa schiedti]|nr:hypothetical protein Pelo_539 [Pelomyxa schiedti]